MVKYIFKMFFGSSQFSFWSALLLFTATAMREVLAEDENAFRCFNDTKYANVALPTSHRDFQIGLQVTDRPTHQVMTRIFAIFLKEILSYRNVSIVSLDYDKTMSMNSPYDILDTVRIYNSSIVNMINLEVWMPYSAFRQPSENISNAGASIPPGRFGWFVPKDQISQDGDATFSLHYEVFRNMSNIYYDLYVMDDNIIREYLPDENIRNKTNNSRCLYQKCVTIIAEYYRDTEFIVDQLEKTNSYINVVWLEEKFMPTVRRLHQRYLELYANGTKRFIVLHWTPSEIIDAGIGFTQITMPRCEDFEYLQHVHCKYELMPILKYYAQGLDADRRLKFALWNFFLRYENLETIYRLMQNISTQREGKLAQTDFYNLVACNFLQLEKDTYKSWVMPESVPTLLIGGIFPINTTSRGHIRIVEAAASAVAAINRNKTILPGYNLHLMVNNGNCESDKVMTSVIHYYSQPYMLGVLGPACSETVEPAAGISKHMNMLVMSYSAEGSLFLDREKYPYFFRTIGSNSQYKDAYISMLKHFEWTRVAALTDDGEKYTEYISDMESMLKHNNFKLIVNRKIGKGVTPSDMREYLLELKQARGKIIIADIQIHNAAMALCEALKLGMTYQEGYVWFLPAWLSKNFEMWQTLTNNSCTAQQLQKAAVGHLSIRHKPFGEPNMQMQERKSVAQWRKDFNATYGVVCDYVGYAYDAVWAYAMAAQKLVHENRDAFSRLRRKNVADRLAELLWETDFAGLSGRVRFGKGGSRIAALDILQWDGTSYVNVGDFSPHIVDNGTKLHTDGGTLSLQMEKLHWFDGKQPDDGKYDCEFASIARLLGTSDCELAVIVFAILMCLLAVLIISVISFQFWKQRYDSKLRRSAKIMKTFGIDLLSSSQSSCNTLDKWAIPKECVVINRRLGEGAFGTVYGGEAQLKSGDWTAVAVKTLKAGTSAEDRFDFLCEAEAMKRFDHKNIIKLLAVCLQSEPIYTIMEFMLYGDLKTYLLARRNMVNERVTDESDISAKRLTIYAMDIARGLAYLTEQKYVHRDLACRNCLVDAQRVVKIGDFGMARPTFESNYYRFNRREAKVPVRWLAPETLATGMCMPASDIWAYGVVLYEIITFGSYPYQGLTHDQVSDYVKGGNTLQIPSGVKPPLEGLLKSCWNMEPAKRPTALEIIDYISSYPKLLTPSLDFPGSAVEMPETESDQVDLLTKARKCPSLMRNSNLDVLSPNQTNFNSEVNAQPQDMCETDSNENAVSPQPRSESLSPVTPDGYSVMMPLLMCDNSGSSQAPLIQKSNSNGF